jgi:hypothetical protein
MTVNRLFQQTKYRLQQTLFTIPPYSLLKQNMIAGSLFTRYQLQLTDSCEEKDE